MNGTVEIATSGGTRAVALSAYLDAEAEERAQCRAREWIKALRGIDVDGQPMRARFTAGGDALWWFTEIYLHKEQAVLTVMRTIAAMDALVEREQPSRVHWQRGDAVTEWVANARAATLGLTPDRSATPLRLAAAARRLRARGHALRLADARSGSKRTRLARATIAAFVHRAFVNPAEGAAAGERYLGRVLTAVEQHLPPGGMQTIVVGPRRSFRTRKWWDPMVGGDEGLIPIEAVGGGRTARDREIWHSRHDSLAALERSDALRRHAVVDGTDCWPVIRTQLVGVAWLQWPWSVRAMDRAGAALDAVQPRAAITYAEAGGWGRALALEARQRGIPLVGVQHGFIYRHWLNYVHEPDEIGPCQANPSDRGFPRPALTLVFDRYAERHLLERAHFPSSAVEVVGSAERDALADAARGMTEEDRAELRQRLAVPAGRKVVLCATKFTEAKDVLPALAAAMQTLPSVHLIIKAHPAENTEGYAPFESGNVTVVPAAAPLTDLLGIAAAVVTVNSTVAVDALALGIPALTLGGPNNLTPFVEAGAMLGANDARHIADSLSQLLTNEQLRTAVVAKGRALVGTSDGRATERAARAVLALTGKDSSKDPGIKGSEKGSKDQGIEGSEEGSKDHGIKGSEEGSKDHGIKGSEHGSKDHGIEGSEEGSKDHESKGFEHHNPDRSGRS